MTDSAPDTPELLRRVGSRVKAARETNRLSQSQIAERVGMNRSSIANLEAGRQDMTISRLAVVAAAVNLNLADLIRPEDLPGMPPLAAVFDPARDCRACGYLLTSSGHANSCGELE